MDARALQIDLLAARKRFSSVSSTQWLLVAASVPSRSSWRKHCTSSRSLSFSRPSCRAATRACCSAAQRRWASNSASHRLSCNCTIWLRRPTTCSRMPTNSVVRRCKSRRARDSSGATCEDNQHKNTSQFACTQRWHCQALFGITTVLAVAASEMSRIK